ncbi:MAG: MoaD/ThiS family protein [Anaerolineae bacterium]|nr:MoaD/ThiS family protein [Anaerolineae bacterium]
MIAVSVRLNGQLATTVGAARLQLSLPDHATVAHLVASLARQYPAAGELALRAVPIVDGRHVTPATPLVGVREVALLMPISGG